MKIIFMGTPDFAVGTLEALIEAGHEITLVVSQPDKPKGRGHELIPTPVKEVALAHGLRICQTLFWNLNISINILYLNLVDVFPR